MVSSASLAQTLAWGISSGIRSFCLTEVIVLISVVNSNDRLNTTVLHNLTKTLILHPIGECIRPREVVSLRSDISQLPVWRVLHSCSVSAALLPVLASVLCS